MYVNITISESTVFMETKSSHREVGSEIRLKRQQHWQVENGTRLGRKPSEDLRKARAQE